MKASIIYWSKTGNTEKVALAIQEGLAEAGWEASLKRVEDAGDVDFYACDLVCIGFPSYQWRPPKPMDAFQKSVEQILGKDALDIKKKSARINIRNLNNAVFLEDFFMKDKDWMEGDQEEEQGL